MEEIWKDIKGYEGRYQISNLGRVKSIKVFNAKSNKYVYVNKIKKPTPSKFGYLRVSLTKDRKTKKISVHRLVAIAFIPNPNNLATVNHKDYNKKNNCVDNLEWLSGADNTKYSSKMQRNMPNKPSSTGYKYITTKRMNGVDYYRLNLFDYNKFFRKEKYTLEQVIKYRDNLLKEVMKDGKFNITK